MEGNDRKMPRVFWALLAATLAAWLAMNLVTARRIEAFADGQRLLDMRFNGYSFEEVRSFVAAIGDEGAALYLGAQFWLDMVFPALLGAVLIICYLRLFPSWLGLIMSGGAFIYIVIDYLENFAIATMLHAGANGITQDMAATADQWTTTKWGLAFVGLAALIFGLAMQLRQRLWSAK